MAVHWKPEPPSSLEEWRRYEEECRRQDRPDWIPEAVGLSFPEGYIWTAERSVSQIVLDAEDHPFAGREFCWRCLAEAQDLPAGPVPHERSTGIICWASDPEIEDDIENAREATDRAATARIADPERPALCGTEEFRRWWLAGASIVARQDRPDDFTDTGTSFYDRPSPQSAGS